MRPFPQQKEQKKSKTFTWWLKTGLFLALTLIALISYPYKHYQQEIHINQAKINQQQIKLGTVRKGVQNKRAKTKASSKQQTLVKNESKSENQTILHSLSKTLSAALESFSAVSHSTFLLQNKSTPLMKKNPTTTQMRRMQTTPKRSFYAMGDIPYDDDDAELLVEQLQELKTKNTNNDDDAAFMIHLGDAMSSDKCDISEYDRVRQIFLQHSQLPVFIIPGDNDWNDCPDPDEAWELWNQHFFQFEKNWNLNFRVFRQPQRKENFAFFQRQVLYIGLNLVGGKRHDKSEWKLRLKQNYDWTRFNLERFSKWMEAVVIFGHTRRRSNVDDFFKPLKYLVREEYRHVPFLYLHGDGHKYRRKRWKRNVLDLQVDEGKEAPPLKVLIDYETDISLKKKFSVYRRGGKY